jgi:hypothetical protein
MQSTHYSSRILTELKFSRHIFEKYVNIKFHENPSSGSRVVPRGMSDLVHGQSKAVKSYPKPPFRPPLQFVFVSRSMVPIPVVALCKAWVYDLSVAGIVGLNPAGGMDVCLL